jgi:hypothetical protein
MRQAAMLLLLLRGLLQADTYSLTDLGSLGGSSTVAFGINSSGTAVGWGETSSGDVGAFSSSGGGSMQNLPGLAGATDTYAYGIKLIGRHGRNIVPKGPSARRDVGRLQEHRFGRGHLRHGN